MLTLRDYQEKCVELVLAAYQENQAGVELIVLPTAAGKTIVFAEVIRQLNELHGLNTLVIAHRDELLDQAADKYRMVKPDAIIGKVGSGIAEYGGEVTIANVATISRAKHLKQLKAIGYALVIVDEAHHVAAPGYQKVLEALPDSFKLFVTATPDRLDNKPVLKDKEPLYSASIVEMVQQKYLCDIRAIAIRTEVSLDEIDSRAGDFKVAELDSAINTPARNRRVVLSYLEHAEGRRAICFCVTISHAQALATAFNEIGVPAAFINGDRSIMPIEERKKLYQQLHDGTIKVLCNVQVLTEGFDEPLVSCVIMARPTQSRALYVQCLDDQTEILTPVGWKSRNDIQQGDLVAGYDKETEAIRWVPAINKVERLLAPGETMYALQSPALDIRVTGGHRMVFRARNRTDVNSYNQYPNKSTPWRFVEAETLAKRGTEYELPISGYQHASGLPLTDDELRFIGWFLTDGTLNKITNQISIYQAAHQPHHEAIRSCLDGCGFKYSVREITPDTKYNATSNQLRYLISKGKPRGTDKHLTGWEKLEPYIDKSLSTHLENISTKQLEVLLEAIHLGDGAKQLGQSWTRRSYHIITGNSTFAERLQSLCVRRGFKCNIAKVKREQNTAFHIHIKKTQVQHVGGKNSQGKSQLKECSSLPGEIAWCIENELSTLVTRRNGKVAIVGNCIGRGLRLAPDKVDCVILDLTDNSTRHRLKPQKLSAAIGKDLKDNETLAEMEVREEAESLAEKQKIIHKINEHREKDKIIDLLTGLPEWEKLENGVFRLTIGNHKIAVVPSRGMPGQYHVDAKLAPGYQRQRWMNNQSLDWCQAFAEQQARKILENPKNIRLVDSTQPWKSLPASEPQKGLLRRYNIVFDNTITKGQAGQWIDEHKLKLAQEKAAAKSKAHIKEAIS